MKGGLRDLDEESEYSEEEVEEEKGAKESTKR